MYCRICSVHKSHSHHKLMSDRAQMIKYGTYLSRDEANAERLKRKEMNGPKSLKIDAWVWDWNQAQYVEYELVEEPITDNELQALISVKEAASK